MGKREIKFRGLRTDGKGWVYGYYSPVNVPILGTLGHCINEGGYRVVDIEYKSLGQYTGLKNKSGQDIYEGDIIKFNGQNCPVIFGKKTLGFGYHFNYKTNWNEIVKFYRLNSKDEVIGNIHENPELIPK